MKSLINTIRYIIAEWMVQISFFAVALLVLLVWAYTHSTLLTIAVGIISLALVFYLASKIEGKGK